MENKAPEWLTERSLAWAGQIDTCQLESGPQRLSELRDTLRWAQAQPRGVLVLMPTSNSGRMAMPMMDNLDLLESLVEHHVPDGVDLELKLLHHPRDDFSSPAAQVIVDQINGVPYQPHPRIKEADESDALEFARIAIAKLEGGADALMPDADRPTSPTL